MFSHYLRINVFANLNWNVFKCNENAEKPSPFDILVSVLVLILKCFQKMQNDQIHAKTLAINAARLLARV